MATCLIDNLPKDKQNELYPIIEQMYERMIQTNKIPILPIEITSFDWGIEDPTPNIKGYYANEMAEIVIFIMNSPKYIMLYNIIDEMRIFVNNYMPPIRQRIHIINLLIRWMGVNKIFRKQRIYDMVFCLFVFMFYNYKTMPHFMIPIEIRNEADTILTTFRDSDPSGNTIKESRKKSARQFNYLMHAICNDAEIWHRYFNQIRIFRMYPTLTHCNFIEECSKIIKLMRIKWFEFIAKNNDGFDYGEEPILSIYGPPQGHPFH